MERDEFECSGNHDVYNYYLRRNVKNRNLEVGDFAAINEVFGRLEISIDVAEPIVINIYLGDVTVDISNLICRNIDIGDMDLLYDQPEKTSVSFRLNVIQFDIECSFDYSYDAPSGSEWCSICTSRHRR